MHALPITGEARDSRLGGAWVSLEGPPISLEEPGGAKIQLGGAWGSPTFASPGVKWGGREIREPSSLFCRRRWPSSSGLYYISPRRSRQSSNKSCSDLPKYDYVISGLKITPENFTFDLEIEWALVVHGFPGICQLGADFMQQGQIEMLFCSISWGCYSSTRAVPRHTISPTAANICGY